MGMQRWVEVGPGAPWDPRAPFHKRTHLTGQGAPGRWGRPSSPTVAHCSPGSLLLADRGFFSASGATPSPDACSLRPRAPAKPQALTTKSALFFGGLTSDVRCQGAKPPAKRTSPAHFFLVRGSLAGGHKQHVPTRLPGLQDGSPVSAVSVADGQLAGGAAGLLRVLQAGPEQVQLICGDGHTTEYRDSGLGPIGAAAPAAVSLPKHKK